MSLFYNELSGQPNALDNTIEYYTSDEGRNLLDKVQNLWKTGQYDTITFTGMGSSYFVSESAACMLNAAGFRCQAIDAGELLHFRRPCLDAHTILVAISQSGESYEIVELLNQLSDKRPLVIGITNTPGSTLDTKSDISLRCIAGKEEMTSTKTFICTYLVSYILSKCFKGEETDFSHISPLAGEIRRLLDAEPHYILKALDMLGESGFVQVIARGSAFATASQTALMFMEATKTPASALLGGEFRHGPLEMVHEGFVGVIFAHSASGVSAQMQRLAADILNFGGKVLYISDKSLHNDNANLLNIHIDCADPDLFAIPAIVPLQVIVDKWAEHKHLTPGNFTRACKVTATE